MRRIAIAFCLLAAAAGTCCFGEADAEAIANRFGNMYFAQMDGGSFWRMYDPETGIIEFRNKSEDGRIIEGAAGWNAIRNGEEIRVAPPSDAGLPGVEFRFRKGRPTVFGIGGQFYRVDVEEDEIHYSGPVPQMWDDNPDDEEDPTAGKWEGRFTLFWRNPNLFAVAASSFALIALALMLLVCGKDGPSRKIAAVAAVVFAVMLLMSGSRGAEIGFVAGAALLFAIWLRTRGVAFRKLLAALAVLVVIAVLYFAISGVADTWQDEWGNALRIIVAKAGLRMMADAPGGWDSIARAGDAYMQWYEPLEMRDYLFTLVSGHLTKMAEMGWLGRVLWVFGWLAAIVLPLRKGLCPSAALMSALWLAFGVAAIFNPVVSTWFLWVPPAVVTVWWALKTRPWRDKEPAVVRLICCGVVAIAINAALYVSGKDIDTGSGVKVRLDGSRVLVNGDNPSIWIVDDGNKLGWQMAPKEIRFFCQSVKNVPPLGYVNEIVYLPEKVERLIVAGERCREFLDAWQEGDAPDVKELVFISPPFGPSAVPDALRRRMSFLMVVGEFAARYSDVYGNGPFPDWVGIAPGAEAYIPGWVSFCVAK